MTAILLKLLPLFLIALVAFALKLRNILKAHDSDRLLILAYNLTIPALILSTVPTLDLVPQLILLPLGAALIIVSTYFLGRLYVKPLQIAKDKKGIILMGAMILNNGILIPFVEAAYGADGLGRLLILDLSNAILVFSWVYLIAIRHGENSPSSNKTYKKIVGSPPIWALTIAIIINLFNWEIPPVIASFFKITADMTIPILMISLGIYFTPRFRQFKLALPVVIIRMIGGFFLALFLSYLFNLQGLDRTILILCGSAPIGYNTLTFSALEKLDSELAATMISLAILLSMLMIPAIIYWF